MPANLGEKGHPTFKPLHTNLASISINLFLQRLVPWSSPWMQRYTAAGSNAAVAQLGGGSLMWL